MFDISRFKESLESIEGTCFTPVQVELRAFQCEDEQQEQLPPVSLVSVFPIETATLDRTVISIDAASRILGDLDGGVVGAVRASLVIRENGNVRVERYGPYLAACTSTNSARIYSRLRREVIGATNPVSAPHYSRMPDRVRGFLEKFLLKKAVLSFSDALILYDGSMRVATYDTPSSFFRQICQHALSRGNDLAAVSKQTGLTMRPDGRSILSALDGVDSPHCAMVKPVITQDSWRYYGDIYVCRFVRGGDAFRVDLPPECRKRHPIILSELSYLAGPFGYPEDLRIAHIMSVFYPMEIVGLQSVAAAMYGMRMRENLRNKILGPLG